MLVVFAGGGPGRGASPGAHLAFAAAAALIVLVAILAAVRRRRR